MFTGIVEEQGRVLVVDRHSGGARVRIGARTVLTDANLGASIAVNGVCLTVVEFDAVAGWWLADAVIETMQRTNLGDLAIGDPVNLERPVRLSDRLGGHLVQGHVDGTGTVVEKQPNDDGSTSVRVFAPSELLRYVIEKGSITIDGISLTVVDVDDESFSVAVIPHTLAVTNLGTTAVGSRVNLECDLVAKYIEKLVPHGRPTEGH